VPTHRAIDTAGRFDRRLRQLLDEVAASRVTVRLDWPAMGFHVNDVAGEALQIGERSLRGQTSIDQRVAGTVRWLERERRTLVQHDLAGAEPPAPQALIELYGTRAQMLAPLVHGGALTGWVSVHENRSPRRWTEAEIRAIEAAAAWFVTEIEAGQAGTASGADDNTPSILDYLALRSATRPALARDGRLLAWIDDTTGVGQIWARELPDGEPRRLLATSEKIGLLAFSPTGRDLVFGMDQGGDERQQLWLLPSGEGAARPLTREPAAIHAWGTWDPQGRHIAYSTNARDPWHMDVHVLEVASGEARCVLEEDGWREPLAFSPDGATLLIQDCRRGMFEADLLSLDLATGACEPLLPPGGPARYLAPKWRKDGRGFFFVTNRGREFHGVASYDLDTRELTWVARPEADVVAMALAPDESRLAYVVNREGRHRIVLHELEGGAERTLEGHPPGTIASLAFTPDGTALLFPLTGFTRPSAVWRLDLGGGEGSCIAGGDRQGLGERDLVEPTIAAVPSFDGREVPAFLFEPHGPAPAGGRPALVVVHGGPEMQYDAHWQAEVQYFARRGWLVVAPNVRGSTGYGRTWQALDDRLLRMDAVKDLQAVRAWVAARPDVDSGRLALFGRSYGGFMTLAALTEEPAAWTVAAEFYGVVNFRTLLETTAPWRQVLRAAEYGDPVADRDALERFSPIHRAERIQAPLFIAHGLEDPRVPPSESEMLVSILRGLGKPHEYLRIPGEGHGFARATNREVIYTALARFLERHIGAD
jgi:dipeptidyl aminopeptidase/acylaminoacyl peptidase